MFTTVDQVKLIVRNMLHDITLPLLVIGTVSGTAPLRVQLNQHTEINEENIWVSKNVLGWSLNVDHQHEYTDTHSSGVDTKLTTKNPGRQYFLEEPLKVGDKVLLLRNLGGQQYLLIDKLRRYQDILTE